MSEHGLVSTEREQSDSIEMNRTDSRFYEPVLLSAKLVWFKKGGIRWNSNTKADTLHIEGWLLHTYYTTVSYQNETISC